MREPSSASVPVCVDGELTAAVAFAEHEKSAATRRAYRSDWQTFTAWCSARDLESLPAALETVARFLSWQATAGVKPIAYGDTLDTLTTQFLAHT